MKIRSLLLFVTLSFAQYSNGQNRVKLLNSTCECPDQLGNQEHVSLNPYLELDDQFESNSLLSWDELMFIVELNSHQDNLNRFNLKPIQRNGQLRLFSSDGEWCLTWFEKSTEFFIEYRLYQTKPPNQKGLSVYLFKIDSSSWYRMFNSAWTLGQKSYYKVLNDTSPKYNLSDYRVRLSMTGAVVDEKPKKPYRIEAKRNNLYLFSIPKAIDFGKELLTWVEYFREIMPIDKCLFRIKECERMNRPH